MRESRGFSGPARQTGYQNYFLLSQASSRATSRFQYAILVSLAMHIFVLFGLGIRPHLPKLDALPPALDVVLVNARSESRPDQALALAQHNLDGGGNTDAERRIKSPLPVAPRDRETSVLSARAQRVEQLEQQARALLTQIKPGPAVASAPDAPQPKSEPGTQQSASQLMSRSMEIARLEGQISKDMDSYQKRPRRRFIGARTQEYRFARYVEDWRLKIERTGTLNYPQAAREQKIYGSLQLTVSLRPDGSVDNIEVNRSSGKKILDDAAIRIVNLAAPYAAFPSDIASDTDILSITRTWTFTNSDQLSTE